MLFRLWRAFLYWLSGFMPRDRDRVVLGAWLGKRFADNPRFLAEHLSRVRPGLRLTWIGEPAVAASMPAGSPVRFLPIDSWAARREQLRAGACFITHGMEDLGRLSLMRGAVRFYLGHGLAIKRMGFRDPPGMPRLRRAIARILRRPDRCTLHSVSGEAHREKLLAEYASLDIRPEEIVPTGQPRVDFLLRAGPDEVAAIRERLFRAIGGAAARVVLYLPTFRRKGARQFSFLDAGDGEAVRAALEPRLAERDAVLVEKGHFTEVLRGESRSGAGGSRVVRLGAADFDTQELLLVADVLLTDYSGCYVDYLVLDRPIVHFAYDLAEYETRDRSLYLPLGTVAGGDIARDHASLVPALLAALDRPEETAERRRSMRAWLATFETGEAAAQVELRAFGR